MYDVCIFDLNIRPLIRPIKHMICLFRIAFSILLNKYFFRQYVISIYFHYEEIDTSNIWYWIHTFQNSFKEILRNSDWEKSRQDHTYVCSPVPSLVNTMCWNYFWRRFLILMNFCFHKKCMRLLQHWFLSIFGKQQSCIECFDDQSKWRWSKYSIVKWSPVKNG